MERERGGFDPRGGVWERGVRGLGLLHKGEPVQGWDAYVCFLCLGSGTEAALPLWRLVCCGESCRVSAGFPRHGVDLCRECDQVGGLCCLLL
ncbi:unnamed protein product [Linum tenue]|uniref:Uncharacterized protein n=1 Tax=Linum tenue TaxID=586396 RepID=A0AAV0S386_9ROSI|nr:unnamed protein product [Linum tenue]